MKKLFILLLVLIALVLSQCAYFNTFYNAKRYFRIGYLATQKNVSDQVSSQERSNYLKTIEKCAKILEFYPKSRYVDDALLLMGKAYFYLEEYVKASRKFEELTSNYPQSEFAIEAGLWHARALLEMQEFESAEDIMNDMAGKEIPSELKGDAFYYFGLFHQKRESYENAIDAFIKAAKTASKDLRIKALISLGETLDTTGVYLEAAEAYKNVLKYDPVDEVEFLSQYQYGRMLRKAGKPEEAIDIFERLLREQIALSAGNISNKNNSRIPNLRLQIAACLENQGNIEDAIVIYQDIPREFEKKPPAAKALYELGKIYEYYYGDYFRASDNYKQAQEESRNSVWADSAKVMQRDIERLEVLQRVILMSEGKTKGKSVVAGEEEIEEDTLTAQIIFDMMKKSLEADENNKKQKETLATIASKQFADSVALLIEDFEYQRMKRDNQLPESHEGEGVNWALWYDSDIMPSFSQVEFIEDELAVQRERYKKFDLAENKELSTFNVEEKDKNLFFLAELYWFRFDLPDSAKVQYLKLINEFPKSEYASQAVYNLAYLQHQDNDAANDTSMQYLIKHYPQSQYANVARKWLDLPLKKTLQDSILELFHTAEAHLLEKDNVQDAIDKYETIYQNFPETDYAAKALYSIGWIYDHELHQPDTAMVIYDSLLTQFPQSVYAGRISAKLSKTRAEMEKAKQDTTQTLATDSTAVAMPADSLNQMLIPDSLRQSAAIDTNSATIEMVPVKDKDDALIDSSSTKP